MSSIVRLSETALRFAAPVALFGWYVFVLFGPYSTTGASAGIGLVLLASVAALPHVWQDVRREPVFWLVLALTAYILGRSLLALQVWPVLDHARNPHWSDVLRMSGLIAFVMGWWLYRYPRHFVPILAVALVGFLVGPIYRGEWGQILAAEFSGRWMWGYRPNYLGLVSGTAILALLSWLLVPVHGPVIRRGLWLGLPLLAVAGFLLYTSQSRSAWIGLPVGLLVVAVGMLRRAPAAGRARAVAGVALLALLLCALAIPLMFDGGGLLMRRVTEEWGTVQMVLAGNLDAAVAAQDSTGLRIQMWIAGAQAFAEKPLFGWGPGAGVVILRGLFTSMDFGHFHNLYLELLIGLGVVGAALFAAIYFFFLRGVVRACARELYAPPVMLGLLAVSAFVAVSLLFTIRIGQTEGRALLTLITALYAVAVFRTAAPRGP